MISSKQPGVISGWQLEPSGDILYSHTLPNDTIISELVVSLCLYAYEMRVTVLGLCVSVAAILA